jgi:hypothetical protein
VDRKWQSTNKSVFCPFALVKERDQLVTLAQFHKKRSQGKVKLEADFFLENWEEIERLLIDIYKAAIKLANPKKILSLVFSHLITIDGSRFKVDWNQLTSEQIKSCIVPFICQVNTDKLLQYSEHVQKPVLCLSGNFLLVLHAIFRSDGSKPQENIVHFHWGARSMSGLGTKKSYFFETESQKKLATLFAFMQTIRPAFRNLSIVILPAPVFLYYSAQTFGSLETKDAKRFKERSFFDAADFVDTHFSLPAWFLEEKLNRLSENVSNLFYKNEA